MCDSCTFEELTSYLTTITPSDSIIEAARLEFPTMEDRRLKMLAAVYIAFSRLGLWVSARYTWLAAELWCHARWQDRESLRLFLLGRRGDIRTLPELLSANSSMGCLTHQVGAEVGLGRIGVGPGSVVTVEVARSMLAACGAAAGTRCLSLSGPARIDADAWPVLKRIAQHPRTEVVELELWNIDAVDHLGYEGFDRCLAALIAGLGSQVRYLSVDVEAVPIPDTTEVYVQLLKEERMPSDGHLRLVRTPARLHDALCGNRCSDITISRVSVSRSLREKEVRWSGRYPVVSHSKHTYPDDFRVGRKQLMLWKETLLARRSRR
jgi:hypothetical protein